MSTNIDKLENEILNIRKLLRDKETELAELKCRNVSVQKIYYDFILI